VDDTRREAAPSFAARHKALLGVAATCLLTICASLGSVALFFSGYHSGGKERGFAILEPRNLAALGLAALATLVLVVVLLALVFRDAGSGGVEHER